MKRLPCFKDFDVSPLDGGFDARSPSGKVSANDFRVVLNMDLVDQRKRCRMGGWKKLFSDSAFGFLNQDLHDQLLDCQMYYEALGETVVYGPYDLAECVYPFFVPDEVISDQVIKSQTGPFTGYAPDYYDEYAYQGEFDQDIICEPYIGYPYNGEGESFFFICHNTFVPGETIEGYGYGDLVCPHIGPYSFERNYCGDYPYRRPHQCSEAITLLYEAVSVAGRRQLVAASKSRIWVLNERAGNWRILADGLGGSYQADDNCGCSDRRFKVAQMGNFILFTNDFDPVMIWEIDSGPGGCDLWSVSYIADLLALNITSARVVAAWEGFTFIANVIVDNERHASRIYWSDLNDPNGWAPGLESLAGFFDLGLGEAVLEIKPIGGQLRIYTSRGDEKAIYEISIVGGEEVLNFREIYRGPDGLEYEYSLVSTGQAHIWLSSSGIMVLGEYDRVPQRLEWTYKSDGVFYNGISAEWLRDFDGLNGFGPVNRQKCGQIVGGYNSDRKQIWFSWPTDDNDCPNMSLVINPLYRAATLVDHGFTAFAMFRPDFARSLRDFLAEYAGCNPALFIDPKEGQPLDVLFGDSPAYVRNYAEDPDLPIDPDSVCAALAGVSLQDLCESCGAASVFVMADASDKTLKEFTPDQYYRERYIPENVIYECPQTTPGNYALDGYYSMLQGDAGDFKVKTEKLINQVAIDFIAEDQTTPSKLYCEIAYGYQPGCMRWDKTAKPRTLECLTNRTQRQHAARGSRASRLPSFKFFRKGVYLAWRFYVKGTGGGACFNGVTRSVRPATGTWD